VGSHACPIRSTCLRGCLTFERTSGRIDEYGRDAWCPADRTTVFGPNGRHETLCPIRLRSGNPPAVLLWALERSFSARRGVDCKASPFAQERGRWDPHWLRRTLRRARRGLQRRLSTISILSVARGHVDSCTIEAKVRRHRVITGGVIAVGRRAPVIRELWAPSSAVGRRLTLHGINPPTPSSCRGALIDDNWSL